MGARPTGTWKSPQEAEAGRGQAEPSAAPPGVPREQPPQQGELPFAIVQGTPLLTLPLDLYIPPDALEVFLDAFEGPLDLLLYLIKRQNLDILEIPVAQITDQYMVYVDLMSGLRLELAAEYLVMAAMLAEIKSRMLLPRPSSEDAEEEDPRAELIRRLQEYERFKNAAQDLDALPRLERDHFPAKAEVPPGHIRRLPPSVDLRAVLLALRDVLARADLYTRHRVERESLSLRERMSLILERLASGEFMPFTDLFPFTEGRAGVVVTFLAILELIRGASLELVQAEPFSPIHVRLRPGGGRRNALHILDPQDADAQAAQGNPE
jgi:segregation and condensation protein A